MTQEEWKQRAEELRQQLAQKRQEVAQLEEAWKEANRQARGDWSAEAERLNRSARCLP